jgi:hypothetical protein
MKAIAVEPRKADLDIRSQRPLCLDLRVLPFEIIAHPAFDIRQSRRRLTGVIDFTVGNREFGVAIPRSTLLKSIRLF